MKNKAQKTPKDLGSYTPKNGTFDQFLGIRPNRRNPDHTLRTRLEQVTVYGRPLQVSTAVRRTLHIIDKL